MPGARGSPPRRDLPGGLRRSGQPRRVALCRWVGGGGGGCPTGEGGVAANAAGRPGARCLRRAGRRGAIGDGPERFPAAGAWPFRAGRREGAAAGRGPGGGGRQIVPSPPHPPTPPVGRTAAWESAGLPGGGVLGGENKGPPAGAGRELRRRPRGAPSQNRGGGGGGEGGVHPLLPLLPPGPAPAPQPVGPLCTVGSPGGYPGTWWWGRAVPVPPTPAGQPGVPGTRGAARGWAQAACGERELRLKAKAANGRVRLPGGFGTQKLF